MNRRSVLLAGLLLLTGCPASNQAAVTVRPKVASASPGTATAAAGRTISFEVRGLSSLADATGAIVNKDPAGIVAQGGGNIVAQGGGNIVAQGGGNIVAQGGGNAITHLGLLATTAQSTFPLVANAVVHVEDLNGNKVSKAFVEADAHGKVTLMGVPDGKPLLVIGQWKGVDGTVRRTSAIVAVGPPVMTVQVDPINQFVQGRIRMILQTSHKDALISSNELAKVWGVFNTANIPIDPSVLDDDASLTDLNAFYTNNIGKLDACGAFTVKQYMATLNGLPQPTPPATCAPAAAASGATSAASVSPAASARSASPAASAAATPSSTASTGYN